MPARIQCLFIILVHSLKLYLVKNTTFQSYLGQFLFPYPFIVVIIGFYCNAVRVIFHLQHSYILIVFRVSMFSGPCKNKQTDFLIQSKNFWAFCILLYFLFVSICWSIFFFLQRKKVNPKQILPCKTFPQGCSNRLLCHKSESTHQRNSPFSCAPGRHTYIMFIWVILLSSVIVIALYIFLHKSVFLHKHS